MDRKSASVLLIAVVALLPVGCDRCRPRPGASTGTGAGAALPCGNSLPGGPTRAEPAVVCDDPAVRKEKGAPFSPAARVWLDVVVTKVDGKALWTRAEVEQDIAFANQVWRGSTIGFILRTYTVSDTIPPDVTEQSVASDPIFAPDANLTVLYVREVKQGPNVVGGIALASGTGIIVNSVSNEHYPLLPHELGHLLGLRHTFECGPAAGIGDGVDDTPFDPGPVQMSCGPGTPQMTCALEAGCTAGTCDACRVTCTPADPDVRPDPRNLMAGYGWACRTVTSGQMERMRCTLRTMQARVCSGCSPTRDDDPPVDCQNEEQCCIEKCDATHARCERTCGSIDPDACLDCDRDQAACLLVCQGR